MHFIISQKLMPRMLLTGSGLCLALLANVKVHSRSLLYGSGQTRGKAVWGEPTHSPRLLELCLSRFLSGVFWRVPEDDAGAVPISWDGGPSKLVLGAYLALFCSLRSLSTLSQGSPHGKVMVWPIGRVVSHRQNEDTAAHAPMRGCRD